MRIRTVCGIAVVAPVVFWVIGLGCWPVVIWSRLHCTYEDIDINSGRIRRQRYLVGLCTDEWIAETSVSRLTATDTGNQLERWHRVNTFSPSVHHSPHYAYHGAIAQISVLDSMWNTARFAPAAKPQMARDVLLLWQTGGGYHPVSRYLQAMETIYSERVEGNKPIDIEELPAVESIRKNEGK